MDKKRGRPRNNEAEASILAASYDLLLEAGFGAVTVEKIAERAKVSKATIYKWWPNKAAVVLDGYLSAASARLPVPDTGSVQEDIRIHATNLAVFLCSREGRVITELIGEAQFDAGLAEANRTRFFAPRRQEARELLERGVARGELKKDLDVNYSIDLMYGPIFYRLLITGDMLNGEFVEKLLALAFEGIRA
ncbi:TetR family transcriptional regulator [Paenibacillus helianthi]|uniref:TetR family transcriptional regulator n=1 Tax=Paenibacillus helianthi TaxID=1349432 RepID=A0ABX3ELY8_9BACL|nr:MULTISPECIES: TetR/AcrR family transcriptional regulator [Paenibacillus]OKP83611.1 TetR family transcriptional regulator [Paenibacillus sp. P3E]OKP83986.1 TetR family transcriptional regulator [Paenibacillus helianthi]OKP94715.1 TetR family transcriptional regulator [Paenibacillus sp. P32E]